MNIASFVLLSLVAQAAPPTDSLESKTLAQSLLKAGAQHYERAEFADALEKFEQAYASFPSPKLLFNIGQASRELGRPVDAVGAFEEFLLQATDAPAEMTAEAKRSVAELLPKIGKLLIECPVSGAEISVDGKKVGQAPIDDLFRVSPGNHQVTAMFSGMTPAIENVTVAAGTVQTVVLRLRAIVEVPATPPELAVTPAPSPAPALDVTTVETPKQPTVGDGWWLGRKWTWVAAGSAVVFAGAGVIAGRAMQSKFDELNQKCGSGSDKWATGCNSSEIGSVDTRKNIANAMWGLSAAAVVTTGVLFLVEGRPVAVAPMVGQANGLVAHVSF